MASKTLLSWMMFVGVEYEVSNCEGVAAEGSPRRRGSISFIKSFGIGIFTGLLFDCTV